MVHPLDGINAMRIGVSRIDKNDEYQLVVESDVQLRSCLTDEKYDASVAFSSQSSEIFCSESDLNVKVLKLQASEYARLRAGQILFRYFALQPAESLADLGFGRDLVDGQITHHIVAKTFSLPYTSWAGFN